MKVSAILWDYDGTLVDSTRKNMEVTIDVLRRFHKGKDFPIPEILTSVEKYLEANYRYKNWRELYKNCYQLSEEQVNEAGKLWSPCQLANETLADLYPGLDNTIKAFAYISQGICSQNASANIHKSLDAFGLASYFTAIIGYEEVSNLQQKPDPAGFLKCIEQMGLDIEKTALIYIGDHQEDVVFAKNAEHALREAGQEVSVISIAVGYSGSSPETWHIKPDYIANSAEEINRIIHMIQGEAQV